MRHPVGATHSGVMIISARASSRVWRALILAEQSGKIGNLEQAVLQGFHRRGFLDIRAKGVEVSTIDARAFAQATAKVQDKWLASPAGPYIAKVVKAAGAQSSAGSHP